jgi:hypothetical protein
VNRQLLQLTENRPFFVYYMMTCQIIVLAVSMGVYGVAPISFSPSSAFGGLWFPPLVSVFDTTFKTAQQEQLQSEDGNTNLYTRVVRNNFWIGPSLETLVTMGAKYAPCMREDDRVRVNTALTLAHDLQPCIDYQRGA